MPDEVLSQLAQDGKLPGVKVGKHWRFLKKDLDRLFVKKDDDDIKIRCPECNNKDEDYKEGMAARG